jgi:hypothetical protein
MNNNSTQQLSGFTSAELFSEIAMREAESCIPPGPSTHQPEIIEAAFEITSAAEPGNQDGCIRYIFNDGSSWECYAPGRV